MSNKNNKEREVVEKWNPKVICRVCEEVSQLECPECGQWDAGFEECHAKQPGAYHGNFTINSSDHEIKENTWQSLIKVYEYRIQALENIIEGLYALQEARWIPMENKNKELSGRTE